MSIQTLNMEARKDGLRQCQDGTWKLSLTVHPNDMSTDLMTAGMGTRYMVAMVEIGDDERPVQKPKAIYAEKTDGEKAVVRAALLCQDKAFQRWAESTFGVGGDEEENAADFIRTSCGIASRSELATNADALGQFLKMEAAFNQATGRLAEVR